MPEHSSIQLIRTLDSLRSALEPLSLSSERSTRIRAFVWPFRLPTGPKQPFESCSGRSRISVEAGSSTLQAGSPPNLRASTSCFGTPSTIPPARTGRDTWVSAVPRTAGHLEDTRPVQGAHGHASARSCQPNRSLGEHGRCPSFHLRLLRVARNWSSIARGGGFRSRHCRPAAPSAWRPGAIRGMARFRFSPTPWRAPTSIWTADWILH